MPILGLSETAKNRRSDSASSAALLQLTSRRTPSLYTQWAQHVPVARSPVRAVIPRPTHRQPVLSTAHVFATIVCAVARAMGGLRYSHLVLVALGLAVSQRLRESLETSCRVPPFQTFRRPRRRVLGNSGLKVDYDEAKYTTAVRSYLASVGYDSCFTIYILF